MKHSYNVVTNAQNPLPLLHLYKALIEHISLFKEKFTCKIHQFRLYPPAHIIVIYVPGIYLNDALQSHHHSAAYYMDAGQASMSCLCKELIQIDRLKCTCSSYITYGGLVSEYLFRTIVSISAQFYQIKCRGFVPDVHANIEKYGLELHWKLFSGARKYGSRPLSSVLVAGSERNVIC